MNIKIQENNDNRNKDKNKTINVKLESYVSDTDIPVVWSFILVKSPDESNVFHSQDSEEGVFLRYPEDTSPLINISVDVEGLYSIKVVADISNLVEKEVISMNLDDNGLIVETVETVNVKESTFIESGILTFEYSEVNNEWV